MTIYTGRAIIPVKCDTATERVEIMEMLMAMGIDYRTHEDLTENGIKYCLDIFVNRVVMES